MLRLACFLSLSFLACSSPYSQKEEFGTYQKVPNSTVDSGIEVSDGCVSNVYIDPGDISTLPNLVLDASCPTVINFYPKWIPPWDPGPVQK